METSQSIEIIENMFSESKKSLHRNSFYFILWGILLIPAGVAEYFFSGQPNYWIIWPILGGIGGIVTAVYGIREGNRAGVQTIGDRITSFTWGAFVFTMVLAIIYTVNNNLSPSPMVLMLAGSATFISGGISKFTPFIWGGIILEVGAILCAFVFGPEYHGLIFAGSILLGYVIPGLILRRIENDKA